MEKRTPHCPLPTVLAMVKAGRVRMTASAVVGAEILGIDPKGMIGVVLALTQADFYKSMTTYADHTLWQDVYRPKTLAGDVYLKMTVVKDVLIVSFKEL